MKQLLTQSLAVLAFLLLGSAVQAQTPFWSEDFAGGIPAGWTNVDASGQGAVWTWCNDPAAGNNQVGCPSIWDDGLNEQEPFAATTATNGFVTVDSDEYGNIPANHVSELTTDAIDCSGKSEVFVTFQTHIGVYTVNAESGAILRVSTDKMNWTDYTIFPGLTTSIRWSANPETPILDISAAAAGSATVYLQWQWTGNYEYQWSLDDIAIYDANPTPRHDVAIGEFFYPASSMATPESQIGTDTFGFFAYLSNQGTETQTNIKLKAYVTTDADDVIWQDSVVIPALAAGVVDSAFETPNQFAPELPIGEYRIKYTVSADSVDLRPFNNAVESTFYVTNNLFSKEDGPEQGYRPSGGGDWYVGNLYTMSAGSMDSYRATLAQFAFATNASELPTADVEATIFLFRVGDNVVLSGPDYNFQDADFLNGDLEWLGVGTYDAPDTVGNYEMQTVEILDFNTSSPGVLLENGARYILAVGYAGLSNVAFHAFNDNVNYLFPSTMTYSDQWYTGGFGGDVNAMLRMAISLVSTTDNTPLPDNTMKIFPNPVSETLNLAVSFDQPTDATITIADLTGRVIIVQDREGLTQENLSYQLQVASGTYLARIATAEGTLTKKFVVQK
ncbi:MAG: T9SS type A sorting domain-containing protein [Bacteroidetes bacterium]|nr:MAG: T9SS type A sorting domain-containing protein [Bacteroidota bacterium]